MKMTDAKLFAIEKSSTFSLKHGRKLRTTIGQKYYKEAELMRQRKTNLLS
jgi:hypothetical protein